MGLHRHEQVPRDVYESEYGRSSWSSEFALKGLKRHGSRVRHRKKHTLSTHLRRQRCKTGIFRRLLVLGSHFGRPKLCGRRCFHGWERQKLIYDSRNTPCDNVKSRQRGLSYQRTQVRWRAELLPMHFPACSGPMHSETVPGF